VKKLLGLIGTFALMITATSPLVACLGQAAIVETELDKVLAHTELDKIYAGQRNEPNDQEIKKAIKTKNSNIDINAIEISDITKESATVTSNNTKYTGAAVTVKFISTNFTELKGITGATSCLIVFNNATYVGTVIDNGAIKTGNLYKSTDGINFENISIKTKIKGAVLSLIVFKNAIYAGTATSETTGILYRSDDGINFEDISTKQSITSAFLSLTDLNNKIYVGTATSKTTGKLYRSTDGTNFVAVAENDIIEPVLNLIVLKNIIFVITNASGKLYRCIDTAASTTFVAIKNITGLVKSWIFFNDQVYFGTAANTTIVTTGKLYKTSDGINVEDVTKTVTNIIGAVTSLIVFNKVLYVGTTTNITGKLYRSTNGFVFTTVAEKDITGAVESLIVNNNRIYVVIATSKTTGKLYRSTDTAGTTFEDISEKESITGVVKSLDVTNDIIYVVIVIKINNVFTGKLYKSDK